jgi:hypothetical protein
MRYLLRAALALAVLTLALGAFAQYPPNNPWLNPGGTFSYYYDPANSTTLASDNNNCTSNTTPCATWKRLAYRMGNLTSGQDSTIVVNLMSTNTGASDAISAFPCFRSGAFVIEGALQQVGSSCTLSGVTAKNTAFLTPQQLTVTASCITARGQFLINTTHASRAFAHSNVSGSTWVVTQPLTQCDAAANVCPRTEVNTWANGDTINVYTFPNADISTLHTTCAESTGYIGITHVTLTRATWMTGAYPVVWEDEVGAGGDLQASGDYPELVNVYHLSGFLEMNTAMAESATPQWAGIVPGLEGGAIQQGAKISRANIGLGAYIGANTLIGGWLGYANSGTSDMYVQNSVVYIEGTSKALGTVWGPGALQLLEGTTLAYTSGSGSTIFSMAHGQVAGINAGGLARWLATDPITGTAGSGIVIFGSNVDTAISGSAGCGGRCWAPGGFGVVAE